MLFVGSLLSAFGAIWLSHVMAQWRLGFLNKGMLGECLKDLDLQPNKVLSVIGEASRWGAAQMLPIDRWLGQPFLDPSLSSNQRLLEYSRRLMALTRWQSLAMRFQMSFAAASTIALVLHLL